jgi:class 3 adenylate cyclase
VSEFLYKILRQPEKELRGRAAVILWLLGDDYAAQSLKDVLNEAPAEQVASLVRRMTGSLKPQIVAVLAPLLRSDSQVLQQALREALQNEASPDTRAMIVTAVLEARQDVPIEAEGDVEAHAELRIDFRDQKNAFRFERENVQELAIVFSDIEGYSRKAEVLSSLQLTNLIREYEGVLFPIAATHRGELIKKMGDGHLFVFRSSLDAVLASLRIQKALKRFNNYREETLRLIARIGLHWGKVVRKEGDVIGNNVNIASRLESSAKGGSVLVSEPVWQHISGHVHCRELGTITVKNIQKPIRVFEPYEIVIDLPEQLDPTKQKEAAAPEQPAQPAASNGLDGKIAEYILATFSTLYDLCKKAEAGTVPVGVVEKELWRRWQRLKVPLQRVVTR